ncbi:stage VI sporulation protein D [Lentibacillus salinarum]|uniref:Stage VI sporulation protein D n=1 Tax=Lentibacillus salinarum TaxID=446820 RepID=A0ABW3ZYR8_9BACI
MENNREIFRFDLDESLFFEKGQEVGEMTGISLDPEIAIQPLHDYISIRGVIELTGSYRKDHLSQDEEEDGLEFDDRHSKRYIERVVNLDDGQAEFTHRFPVEISVPAYRVTDTNDVTVGIESFDYEIPNPNQLKLSSTVEIHGIRDEPAHASENDTQAESPAPVRTDESFAFDLKLDKEEVEPDETGDTGPPPVLSQEGLQTADQQPEVESPSSEKERWKHKKSQTLAEFFGTDQKESPEQAKNPPEAESPESSAASPAVVEYTESGYDNDSYEGYESSASPEDVRYLADMFKGDGDDETYTKMRLCIVQGNDTVESIAERYDISALQLLKQNRLAEDNLEEGQLLYIPYKKQS